MAQVWLERFIFYGQAWRAGGGQGMPEGDGLCAEGEGVNDWCIVLKSFSDWLYALGYPILWIDLSLIRCNLVIGGLCLLMLYQMVVL